jgi:hypothetical protein
MRYTSASLTKMNNLAKVREEQHKETESYLQAAKRRKSDDFHYLRLLPKTL